MLSKKIFLYYLQTLLYDLSLIISFDLIIRLHLLSKFLKLEYSLIMPNISYNVKYYYLDTYYPNFYNSY